MLTIITYYHGFLIIVLRFSILNVRILFIHLAYYSIIQWIVIEIN